MYSRQRELLERKKTLQKEYYKELEEKKIESIGFDYSIGNMYRMLFAHMQTFVSSFYNMLNEAYSESANRTLSAMGVDVNDTDLPRNWKSDNPIPPFTYFYTQNGGDNGRQSVTWPPASLAETRFINRMVMAAMSFGQEETRVSEYIEKLNKETGDTPQSVVYDNANYGESVVKASDYVAITPYDFTVNNPSPYEYLKNNNIQTEFFYQYVFLTFAIRLIYFNIKNNRKPSQTGGNVISDELMSMFGAVEATNFKYGNKEKTKEIITLLEKTCDDFQKYITSKQNEILEFDYPFTGPVLSEKYNNTFDYTFCTGESKDIVFPISMDDPTQLLKVKFNENNFAYLDNNTGFTSENTWVFVKPDVLSEYSTKASNILTDDSYVDTYKKHIIGNEGEDVSDSILAFPSYVYDGKQYPLYGHRFLYLQNRHENEETRLYAKAYAFVMGTHGQHYLPSKNYSGVPYLTSLLSILRVGAAQYRYDYIQEHSGNDLIVLYENQRHAEPTELYITSDKQGFTILSDKKKSYKKIDSEVAQINSKFAKSAKKVFCN